MARVTASDFLHLSVAERIRLAQELWDSVAVHPEQVELTDGLRAELDRRLADLDAHPEEGEPWEVVRARLFETL